MGTFVGKGKFTGNSRRVSISRGVDGLFMRERSTVRQCGKGSIVHGVDDILHSGRLI